MTKEVLEMSKKASSEEGPMSNYWTPSEKENIKELYGCEILVENGDAVGFNQPLFRIEPL